MSLKKKDFYGKEVADAIKSACEDLKVAQENLDIEVVETGSTGIFGLIRKKAHIRAVPKEETVQTDDPDVQRVSAGKLEKTQPEKKKKQAKSKPAVPEKKSEVRTEKISPAKKPLAEKEAESVKVTPQKEEVPTETVQEAQEIKELSADDIDTIRLELLQLLELMGYPAAVNVEAEGTSVLCSIESELEDILIGQDGKTLDSMQYLLRKMIARKIPDRLRLSVDVGNYRERRREELKVRAIELTALVKEDGKTQVIPALSPSERRVVHMTLQDDKEIRSRSVGDGLFKKILIYKPGKGKKGGGRKQPHFHGRKGNGKKQNKSKE